MGGDRHTPATWSRRELKAVLDDVFNNMPREWTAKEGAEGYLRYAYYLGTLARCAGEIAEERSGVRARRPVDLLEIGISMGVVAYGCSVMGMHVTGVDNQKNRNHPVHRRLREKFAVTYEDCDALTDRLPFADASFDLVNSNDMIEHLHGSPKRMLAESHRVLRRGGRIVVTTPNLAALHNRVSLLLGGSVHNSIQNWYHDPHWLRPPFTGHVREYTGGELRYMLREAGFEDVRLRPHDVLPGSVGAPPADAAQLDYSGFFSYLGGLPFRDREFRLRSLRDAAYLAHRLVTAPFPGMRCDLLAVARKA